MSTPSDAWTFMDDPQWQDFHRTWWNNWLALEDMLKDKKIYYNHPKVVQTFCSDSIFRPLRTLYARDELARLYDRLEHLYDTNVSGVVLTGQPGCGKTLSLLYFLTRQLSIGRPVMYTKGLETSFYFCEKGVYEADYSTLKYKDIPMTDDSRGIWSLIDADTAIGEPKESITRYAFPIHAVSPNEQRYKHWRKQMVAQRIFLNPWSIEDLLVWLTVEPGLPSNIDYAALQSLVQLCGPVPREISAHLRGISIETAIANALRNLTLSSFRQQLGHFTSSPSQALQNLIIVWGFAREGMEDGFTVDFKSSYVAEEVYAKWRLLGQEEALRFYQLCRRNAESSFLAGWVFESIAIHTISTRTDPLVPHLRRMQRRESSNVFHDKSMVPCNIPADGRVLHVTEEGAVLQRDDEPLAFQILPTVGTLAESPRNIMHYDDVSSIPLCGGVLFVAKARNNPLFDAFFIEYTPDPIILTIIQITASKRHKGFSSGYGIIRELKSRLGSNVVLRYVLVVPWMERRVTWTLPVGWEPGVAGDVLVQYLNVPS